MNILSSLPSTTALKNIALSYKWYIIGTVVIVIVVIALWSYSRMKSHKSSSDAVADNKIIQENKEHLDKEVHEKFDDTEYRQSTLDSATASDSDSDSEQQVMLKSNKTSKSNRGSKLQSLTSTGCQDKKPHKSIIPVQKAMADAVIESPKPKRKRSKSDDTTDKLDPYSHTRSSFVGEDPFKRPEPFNFLCCDTGLPSGVQLLSRSEGLPHGL